jgi:hypothetical protein
VESRAHPHVAEAPVHALEEPFDVLEWVRSVGHHICRYVGDGFERYPGSTVGPAEVPPTPRRATATAGTDADAAFDTGENVILRD